MRLLRFLRDLRRTAKSEAESPPKQGTAHATDGAEFLIDGDEDLSKLARFRVEARLVKQVPIDRSRPPRSWYGGKPQMPDYLVWPIAEGKPMVFVAQIDCSELPPDLWGGVGPRSGWLLVFLGPTHPRPRSESALPVRVIHTSELGPERNPPANPEVEWLFYETREASPDGAALSFPKWPITVHGTASDAPESSVRFDANKGSRDGARPNPNDLPSPRGNAGNPLTPIGLQMLYDGLTKAFEGAIKAAESRVSSFIETVERFETSAGAEAQSEQQAEDRQHVYDRAKATAPKLAATIPINTAALAALRDVIQKHPVERCPAVMTSRDWNPIAKALNRIPTAYFRWITTRWPHAAYEGEVYRDRRFELVRPGTIEELRASLTEIIMDIAKLKKKLQGSINRRVSLLQRHEALSPEAKAAVTDRRLFELNHATSTLETVKAQHDKAHESNQKLMHVREKLPRGDAAKGPVPDQLWGAALEAVSETVVTDFDLEELLPAITSRDEILIETLLSSNRGIALVETYRRFAAPRLYAEDAELLPPEVRAHFEPIWASVALQSHDGMGGLPRWDWVDIRYFNPAQFMAPEGRKRFMKDNPHWPLAQPPFDRDNAMLLQLFSDSIMGWMWGDVSQIVLLVPRDELAKATFDNVIAIIEG